MPQPVCGFRDADEHPSVWAWERYVTDEEYEAFRASGEVSPYTTRGEVTVLALACDQHAVECGVYEWLDEEHTGVIGTLKATHVHDATCDAPNPPGECSVCAG
jgi:hypothetical protein